MKWCSTSAGHVPRSSRTHVRFLKAFAFWLCVTENGHNETNQVRVISELVLTAVTNGDLYESTRWSLGCVHSRLK